jgi:hypothetical protein
VILSGIYGKGSFSAGQFHFETDGFRENNDLKHDIYHAFLQLDVSPSTSIQAEFRQSKESKGDRAEFFDPNLFFRNRRVDTEIDAVRVGVRQSFTPHSTLLASYSFREFDEEIDLEAGMGLQAIGREERHFIELRYLQDWNRINLTAGIGYFDGDFTIRVTAFPPETLDTRHNNAYVYTSSNYPENVNIILGISGDSFARPMNERNQINPKLGIIWKMFSRTTLRAAAFRVLKRSFTSSQTLEPTQVAGFNQFYDDLDGTDSWRYGIAVDQALDLHRDKIGPELYTGFELSQRELEVPIGLPTRFFDHEEQFARVYLYWTPLDWLALRTEYQFERLEHDPEAFSSPAALAKSETHRLPLEFRVFLSSGFFARTRATYINQRGRFVDAMRTVVPGSDAFWTVDALLGYRFPKRFGLATLEVRNLFNETFQFQDTDPENSAISRDRVVSIRLTVSF